MEEAFVYGKPVTGRYFIDRKGDCAALSNLLVAGENVAILGAPKTGKMSLLQQVLQEQKLAGKRFLVAETDLLPVRTREDFLLALGESVLRAFGSTPGEYTRAIRQFLPETHFVFDQRNYADHDHILSLSWDTDEKDVDAVLNLPFRLSLDRDTRLYLVFKNFDSVANVADWESLLRRFEAVVREANSRLEPSCCTVVFVGGRFNAMRELFVHRRFFHRQAELFTPSPIDDKYIIEYINKNMLARGKVIDKNLLFGVCKLFRCQMWYINHFCAVCDHLSKGYIMEPVMLEGLEALLGIHEPRFDAAMNDLTTFQVSLLRAIMEGNTRFSSSEVIRKYGLNSSANVKRLKDALVKKELVWFDDKDDPHVIDPLFEYWLSSRYFRLSGVYNF